MRSVAHATPSFELRHDVLFSITAAPCEGIVIDILVRHGAGQWNFPAAWEQNLDKEWLVEWLGVAAGKSPIHNFSVSG
jgi:hypothetical protein